MRLIDADKLIKQIDTNGLYGGDDFLKFIKSLPIIQPKKGKWIHKLEDWNRWTCSECGFSKRTDIHVSLGFNFCPQCGADMRGEKHEVD